MKIVTTDTCLTVHLAPWEKLVSLHRDLRIPFDDVTAASVEPEPVRSVRGKLKVGLRIPGIRYLATTDWGRHFIAVRRGEHALHLTLRGRRTRELTLSTPDAERLSERLAGAGI